MGELDCILGMIAHKAKSAKETVVVRQGVGQDLEPAMWFWTPTWQGVLEMPANIDNWPFWVQAVMGNLDAKTVCLCAEAYGTTNTTPRQEKLATAFARGDQNVNEGIVIMAGTHQEAKALHAPYTYHGRVVRWGATTTLQIQQNASGRLVDVLADSLGDGLGEDVWAAVAWCDRWNLEYKIFENATGKPIQPVSPAGNKPCPCGSGQKADRCHWRQR